MHYNKFVSALVGVAACAAMAVTDASAQPSRGGGRRHGGGAIGHAVPSVVAHRTFGPRTRGFYPGRIHTGRIAPRIVNDYPYRSYYYPYRFYRPGFSVGLYRGFGYPYRYGHYAYSYNRYYTPDTTAATTTAAATTTIPIRQEVNTDVPYGWIHASVPYGSGTAVPDHYYSHGGVWTDTSDDAWTATTTSDR